MQATNKQISDMTLEVANGYFQLIKAGMSLSVSDYLLMRSFAIDELGRNIKSEATGISDRQQDYQGIRKTQEYDNEVGIHDDDQKRSPSPRQKEKRPVVTKKRPGKVTAIQHVENIAPESDNDEEMSEFEILRSIKDEWN